jgi:hypothetical protein
LLNIGLVVATGDELAGILDRKSYLAEPDPRRVHVVFLGAEPDKERLDRIAAVQASFAPKGSRDTVTAAGRALYLHTPMASARASRLSS